MKANQIKQIVKTKLCPECGRILDYSIGQSFSDLANHNTFIHIHKGSCPCGVVIKIVEISRNESESNYYGEMLSGDQKTIEKALKNY